MKNHITIILITLLLQACSDNLSSRNNGTPTKGEEQAIEDIIKSEFGIEHLNSKLEKEYTSKPDFGNFVYDGVQLNDGLFEELTPGNTNIIKLKNTHWVNEKFVIVELDRIIAGGSSIDFQEVYLFKFEDKTLTLKTKITFQGHLQSDLVNEVFIFKAENYNDGVAPNCCPVAIETGQFRLQNESLVRIKSSFEELEY